MLVANCQNQNQTLKEVQLETASSLLQIQISRAQGVSPEQFQSGLGDGM